MSAGAYVWALSRDNSSPRLLMNRRPTGLRGREGRVSPFRHSTWPTRILYSCLRHGVSPWLICTVSPLRHSACMHGEYGAAGKGRTPVAFTLLLSTATVPHLCSLIICPCPPGDMDLDVRHTHLEVLLLHHESSSSNCRSKSPSISSSGPCPSPA